MKIKANINGGYRDLLLGKDVAQGKIINEVYAENGIELTKERAKELVAKGIAVIVEDTVIINENDVVDPKEVEEGEAAEVEAEEVIIEVEEGTKDNKKRSSKTKKEN